MIELEYGVTVYPAWEGQDQWRAVWYENGKRRQCEAVSGERLAAKLEKVAERLAADAPNMERPGADLIAHYLDPDRLPADRRWSRTQQRHGTGDNQEYQLQAHKPKIIPRPGRRGAEQLAVSGASGQVALDFGTHNSPVVFSAISAAGSCRSSDTCLV